MEPFLLLQIFFYRQAFTRPFSMSDFAVHILLDRKDTGIHRQFGDEVRVFRIKSPTGRAGGQADEQPRSFNALCFFHLVGQVNRFAWRYRGQVGRMVRHPDAEQILFGPLRTRRML